MEEEAEAATRLIKLVGDASDEGLVRLSSYLDSLRRPALVDAQDEHNNTGLVIAALKGRADAVKLLLAHDANPNIRGRHGGTALHGSAIKGHHGVVTLLLAAGVDASIRDDMGHTALILAANRGFRDIVRTLLQHGGQDVDAQDERGCTALWWAVANNQRAVAKVLLMEGGADMSIPGSGQKRAKRPVTPLEFARSTLKEGAREVLQAWELEPERLYTLHKARCVSELSQTPDRRLCAPLPAFLPNRAPQDLGPCLTLADVGDGSPLRPEGSPSTRGKRRQGDDQEMAHTHAAPRAVHAESAALSRATPWPRHAKQEPHPCAWGGRDRGEDGELKLRCDGGGG